MESNETEKRSSSCLKWILITLVSLAAAASVCSGILYLNWDKILESDFYQSASELGSEFMEQSAAVLELQSELLGQYHCDEIGISFMRYGGGADGAYDALEIELINPEFITVEAGPELEEKALEVAKFAAQHHPEIERYDVVEITFTLHEGNYVTYTEWYDYGFTVAELVE